MRHFNNSFLPWQICLRYKFICSKPRLVKKNGGSKSSKYSNSLIFGLGHDYLQANEIGFLGFRIIVLWITTWNQIIRRKTLSKIVIHMIKTRKYVLFC